MSATRQHKTLRKYHLERSPKCHWCGDPLTSETATLDHLIPASKGGKTDRRNTVIACSRCNQDKADMFHKGQYHANTPRSSIRKLISSMRSRGLPLTEDSITEQVKNCGHFVSRKEIRLTLEKIATKEKKRHEEWVERQKLKPSTPEMPHIIVSKAE